LRPETFEPLDLSQVKTVPLASRRNKVKLADLAKPAQAGASFSRFLDGLPHQLAASDFRKVVEAIVSANRRGRPVIWAMGAHVIKCGLSSLVIQLMERGVLSAVVLNGAGAIHDVELALIGETSEDVAGGLEEGTFGMAEETGRFFSEALATGDGGMGLLLGKRLLETHAPYREHSILAKGASLGVPVTVHVALGTDIVHMHPKAQGGPIGEASFYDFRLLAGVIARLGDGGVYLNVGSAVVLPEVFLKAFTVARNLGHELSDFVTVNLDMQQHYRPLQNVVKRPPEHHGRGYALIGHHELMVPLLVQAVIEDLGDA